MVVMAAAVLQKRHAREREAEQDAGERRGERSCQVMACLAAPDEHDGQHDRARWSADRRPGSRCPSAPVPTRPRRGVEDVDERVQAVEQRHEHQDRHAHAGRNAAHSSPSPSIVNVAPMSRTKCSFSGPKSGTAAGSVVYQPAGSASIQARCEIAEARSREDPGPRIARAGSTSRHRHAQISGPPASCLRQQLAEQCDARRDRGGRVVGEREARWRQPWPAPQKTSPGA